MNTQDLMKLQQSCVLRVNVDCDGCKKKVKKVLQKIDGVYSANVDVEQGKVTVAGNVEPAILIRKLEKLGKHAELWGPQKGSNNYQNILNNQFKNMMNFENGGKGGGGSGGKDNKSQKGGGNNNNHMNQFPKGGIQQQQLIQAQQIMQQQFKGGSKDHIMKMVPNQKDQKQGELNMVEDHFDDEEFDDDEVGDYDEEVDDYDEEDDEEFGHGHHLPNKNNGKGQHGPHGMMMMNGPMMMDVKKGGGGGANFKKGGAADMPFEMMGGKEWKDCKNGKNGKKGSKEKNNNNNNNKGGKKNEGSKKDKSGGGFFGFGKKKGIEMKIGGLLGFGKKKKDGGGGSGGNNKNGKSGSGAGGKNKGKGGAKKGGGKNDYDEVFDMKKMKDNDVFDFDEPNHAGKGGNANGGGGGGGAKGMNQMGPIGQMGLMGNYPMGQMGNYPMSHMGGFPAVQGLPASAAMNGGYYQGMGPSDPYNQQYMGMMMNHPRMDGNEMYHPMMYARQHPPPVNYGGPPMMATAGDNYSEYLSDENANSCSIM